MAALFEQDGSGAVEADGQGGEAHDRQGDDQAQRGDHQVLAPLEKGAAGVVRLAGNIGQRRVGNARERLAGQLAIDIDHQGDGVGQDAEFFNQLPHPALSGRGHGDDHLVHEGHDLVAEQGRGVAQHGHALDLARRAIGAIVEDAQDGDIAKGQGAVDQALGVLAGADDDNV